MGDEFPVELLRFETAGLPQDYDYSSFGLSRQAFFINSEMLDLMRAHAIIMHPFPRMVGIAAEVDTVPRAFYSSISPTAYT